MYKKSIYKVTEDEVLKVYNLKKISTLTDFEWTNYRIFRDYPYGDDKGLAPKSVYVIYNSTLLIDMTLQQRNSYATKVCKKVSNNFPNTPVYYYYEDLTDLADIIEFFERFTQLICNRWRIPGISKDSFYVFL